MLALASLSGTLIPGDWDRRLTYATAGMTNAFAALVLLVENRPSIYLAGTALYLATEGLCWARSTALIVEVVGVETRDARTLYIQCRGIAVRSEEQTQQLRRQIAEMQDRDLTRISRGGR